MLHHLPKGELILPQDPMAALQLWSREAQEQHIPEPTAMSLATVDAQGKPHLRIVLCKSVDGDGLRFFTNYDSHKAVELAARPVAAACFHWVELHRQVRVEGVVERLPSEESDAYFASRPRGSQIGAWASPQSQVIGERKELEARVREVEAKFADGKIPRPANWGGYILCPQMVEFWEGREFRLHERLRYAWHDGEWKIQRLAP